MLNINILQTTCKKYAKICRESLQRSKYISTFAIETTFFDLPPSRTRQKQMPEAARAKSQTRAASSKRTQYDILQAGKPGRCVPRVNLSSVCSGDCQPHRPHAQRDNRVWHGAGRGKLCPVRSVRVRNRPQNILSIY